MNKDEFAKVMLSTDYFRWKLIAWIFIIICIIQTAFIVWSYSMGTEYIEHEAKCSNTICRGEADAYVYEPYEDKCYCYKNGEIIKEEYM